MTRKEQYVNILYSYGRVVLLLLLEYFLEHEDYEECALITEICKECNINVPTSVDEDVIQDWVEEFWKFGLSGEIARANLKHYFLDSLKMLGQYE